MLCLIVDFITLSTFPFSIFPPYPLYLLSCFPSFTSVNNYLMGAIKLKPQIKSNQKLKFESNQNQWN